MKTTTHIEKPNNKNIFLDSSILENIPEDFFYKTILLAQKITQFSTVFIDYNKFGQQKIKVALGLNENQISIMKLQEKNLAAANYSFPIIIQQNIKVGHLCLFDVHKKMQTWQMEALDFLMGQLSDYILTQQDQIHNQDLIEKAQQFVPFSLAASGFGHEIKNPLSVILGQVEVLLQKASQQPQQALQNEKNQLVKIQKHILEISKTIKTLSALYKSHSINDTEIVSANSLTQQALDLCKYRLSNKGYALEINLLQQDSYLRIQSLIFSQILLSIVSICLQNGTKSSEQSKIKVSILHSKIKSNLLWIIEFKSKEIFSPTQTLEYQNCQKLLKSLNSELIYQNKNLTDHKVLFSLDKQEVKS